MLDYQKRSSSPNLAALQAYQRKLASQQASSSGGGQQEKPLSNINRELMYKDYQARLLQFFPSQQVQQEKESDSASPASGADVAQTTLEKQDVQGKGNWQPQADTKAIFSNGSALSSGLMAKYENLMPGVSLGHVSLHQGSQVDAALQTAGLHGLTDGTNVAVASTAPSGTLEHEIGHVAQRQEQGFSLNEGTRQAYETDADHISAKLSNDRPVERFRQTVNSPELAAQLQVKATAVTQEKCKCDENQQGFAQKLMTKSLTQQNQSQAEAKSDFDEVLEMLKEIHNFILDQGKLRLAWGSCMVRGPGAALALAIVTATRNCALENNTPVCVLSVAAVGVALNSFITCLKDEYKKIPDPPEDEGLKQLERLRDRLQRWVDMHQSENNQIA
jgi:hypothetical protein